MLQLAALQLKQIKVYWHMEWIRDEPVQKHFFYSGGV